MKQIYFIRHAVPENNIGTFRMSGFLLDMLGKEDHPLAPEGRQQARRLAPAIAQTGIERLLSSTMLRAEETARIISHATGLQFAEEHILKELIEIAPGHRSLRFERTLRWLINPARPKWLRRSVGSALGPLLGLYYFLRWHQGRTEGGEDASAVGKRLGRVLQLVERLPERRIAIVCHGFLIMYLARKELSSWWRMLGKMESTMHNCSVSRFDLEAGKLQMVYLGRRAGKRGL